MSGLEKWFWWRALKGRTTRHRRYDCFRHRRLRDACAPACTVQEWHMPRHSQTCEGPIEGLYLPRLAWDVFQRENIQTMDQLRAVAGQLERIDGLGPVTAQA